MPSSITLSIDPPTLDVQAGAEASAQLKVQNRSQFVGQYTLSVSGAEAAWATLEPDQLGVFPGGDATATLRVRPPAGAASATYTLTVRAADQNEDGESATAACKVNVRGSASAAPTPTPASVTQAPPRAMAVQAPAQPIAPFAGTPAASAASPGAAQLELAASRDTLTLLPGTQQPLDLRISNRGGTVLNVELSAQGLPAAWLTLTPSTLTLAPGQTAGARLVVAPSADAPSGSYPLEVSAVERDKAPIRAALNLAVEIGEAGGLMVELIPPQAEGQAGAQFEVRVTQSGASAVNVGLEASDAEGVLTYTFDPATLFVPAGGVASSRLNVRARRGLTGGDSRTFPFTVSATPSDGTSAAATQQGRFVQRRTPPLALTIDPQEQTAPASARYTVHVGNGSEMETTVRLSASEVETSCRFQFTPATLAVPPQSQAQTTLDVSALQLHADPGDIIHTFTVRAEPSGDLLMPAETSARFVQSAMELPAVALIPPSASSSGGASYIVQVTNPQAVPVDVELRAYDAANQVALRVDPPQLRVPAKGRAQAKLTARPTGGLLPGEARRPSEFTVEARVVGMESGASTRGALVLVPGAQLGRYVPWAALALLVLAVCIVLALSLPALGAAIAGITGQVPGIIAGLPTPLPKPTFPTSTPTPTNTPIPQPTANVGPFSITGLTASVAPNSASSCPATFNFSAQVSANRAGSLTYVWEFSNGTSTSPATLNFAGAGTQTINRSQSFSTAGPGWGHVKVTAPPTAPSNDATFTLTCAGGAGTATPTAAPTATPTPAVANFAGAWVHNFGTMNLTQSAAHVTGTYFNAYLNANGTVNGNVTGNVFNGNWSISGGTGTIQWTLSPTGTFTGNYNSSTLWCGGRSTAVFQAGCGFAGQWNIRLQAGTRTMTITQTGTTVTGAYFNGTNNGTLDGNVQFTGNAVSLVGNWHINPTTSGPLKFYLLNADSRQFQGNFNTTFEWCGFRGPAVQPTPCLK